MSKLEKNSEESTGPIAAAQKPQVPYSLSKVTMKKSMTVTRILFLTICVGFLLIHIDDGILSVASEQIIHELHFTEADLGLIEAAVYLGITIGSLLCPFLFGRVGPKVLLIGGVICSAACVSAWFFFSNFWLLFSARFGNGIFLVRMLLEHVISLYLF